MTNTVVLPESPNLLSMNKTLLTSLVSLLATAAVASAAVTLPYTNDFSSSVADFTTENGTWTLDSGFYVNTVGGGGVRSSAALDVTGIGGATPQDFTLSTTFSVTGASLNGAAADSVGFALFGDSVSNADSNYLLVDWATDSRLRIRNLGANQDTVDSFKTTSFTLTNSTIWTMTADFVYSGSNLVVTLGITDGGANTDSLVSTPFNTVTTGLDSSIVAFTNREGPGTSGAFTASFDNLSITAVPEPGAVSLFVIGSLGVLTLRRRRRA